MNLCWVYQGGACNASQRPCPWVNGSTLIHHGWVAKKKIGSNKISVFFGEGIDFSYGKSFFGKRWLLKQQKTHMYKLCHFSCLQWYQQKIYLRDTLCNSHGSIISFTSNAARNFIGFLYHKNCLFKEEDSSYQTN